MMWLERVDLLFLADFPGGSTSAWASHPVLSEPRKPRLWNGQTNCVLCLWNSKWALHYPNLFGAIYESSNVIFLSPRKNDSSYSCLCQTKLSVLHQNQKGLFTVGCLLAFFNINCSLKMNFGERNFILLKCLLWIFFLLFCIEWEVVEIDLFLWGFTMWVTYQNF